MPLGTSLSRPGYPSPHQPHTDGYRRGARGKFSRPEALLLFKAITPDREDFVLEDESNRGPIEGMTARLKKCATCAVRTALITQAGHQVFVYSDGRNDFSTVPALSRACREWQHRAMVLAHGANDAVPRLLQFPHPSEALSNLS